MYLRGPTSKKRAAEEGGEGEEKGREREGKRKGGGGQPQYFGVEQPVSLRSYDIRLAVTL